MTGTMTDLFVKATRWSLGTSLLLGMVGCSTISVNVERDPKADFSSYKSYEWSADSRILSPGDKVIRDAFDQALAAKGYVCVADGSADFLVAHRVMVREYADLDAGTGMDEVGPTAGWTYKRNGGWAVNDAVDSFPVQEYAKGTLILMVIDAEAKRVVWRGSATAEVRPGETAEKEPHRIHRAVELLFEDFPTR